MYLHYISSLSRVGNAFYLKTQNESRNTDRYSYSNIYLHFIKSLSNMCYYFELILSNKMSALPFYINSIVYFDKHLGHVSYIKIKIETKHADSSQKSISFSDIKKINVL